jgi:hypothetical protein
MMIQFFATAQRVLPEICLIKGKAISCVRRVDVYAWVFWYAKKSLKSINNAMVCYSYHNTSSLGSESLSLNSE